MRLREGEEDELRAERRRLQHAERIAAGLAEVTALLYDDERSAAARLRRAGSLLRELAGYDPELGAPAEALGEAEAYLEEAVGRARALRDRAPFEPERLAEIDERLDAIAHLKRKYGETAEAVGAYRAQIAPRWTGWSATTRWSRRLERACGPRRRGRRRRPPSSWPTRARAGRGGSSA